MSDLEEELRVKKRQLGALRLRLAKFGISAPVSSIIEEEDLASEVRAIERELGAGQTPTIRERQAYAPPPRYEAPPEPPERFQARVTGQQTKARQNDIEHQLGLLNIHRRNLAILREQARYHGGVAAAPLSTQNGIMDARREIQDRKDVLRNYGQAIDDLPGDE